MIKYTQASIHEKLGVGTFFNLAVDVKQDPALEPKTQVVLKISTRSGKAIELEPDRYQLQRLRDSLDAILAEIPEPRTLPF